MKVIDWIWKNREESIIELIVEDSNSNKFRGLLKLIKVEEIATLKG